MSFLRQHQCADPVGHLVYRNLSHFFDGAHIDRRDRLRSASGNVDGLAIGSESDPGRAAASRRFSRYRSFRQRDVPEQLKVGK